jgi:hypothetical protein
VKQVEVNRLISKAGAQVRRPLLERYEMTSDDKHSSFIRSFSASLQCITRALSSRPLDLQLRGVTVTSRFVHLGRVTGVRLGQGSDLS